MTQVWSSGWNIPGYLPEVDPMNFETWQEAADALREALEQARDDWLFDDPAVAGQYSVAIELLDQCEPDQRFCERVGTSSAWWRYCRNVVSRDVTTIP